MKYWQKIIIWFLIAGMCILLISLAKSYTAPVYTNVTLELESDYTADTFSNVTLILGIEDNPPTVTLNSPINHYNSSSASIIFNCSIIDDKDIANVSLYGNWTGSWLLNETNSSGINNVNYTFTKDITDGTYIWNCYACDNSTGQCSWGTNNWTFTVNTLDPFIEFLVDTNASGTYNQSYIYANINASDLHLDTIIIYLYNSTSLVDSQTKSNCTDLLNCTFSHNFISLSDETYYLNASANDSSGNENQTETRTIILDTTGPLIDYADPTEPYNAYVSQDWIYVNVSVTEIAEDTITFNLYYTNLTLINSTSYTNAARTINWTGLANDRYYYNVTVNDTIGRLNTTSRRLINLDTVTLSSTIDYPTATNYINKSLDLNWTSNETLGSANYSLNGGTNVSLLENHSLTTFNNSLSEENLSFTGDENITRYIELPRYANVTSAYINLSGSVEWVYQEDANSTTCGGTWEGSYPCSNAYDGGWATYGAIDSVIKGNIYFDYNKPSGATDAIWKTKSVFGSTINRSLSTAYGCFSDQDPLQLRVYAGDATPVYYIAWGCYSKEIEPNQWVGRGYTTDTAFRVYEEAIWWKIGSYPVNSYLEVGTPDGIHEEYFSGNLDEAHTSSDFSLQLDYALHNGACDCAGCDLVGGLCRIPNLFHSDEASTMQYSALEINYTLTKNTTMTATEGSNTLVIYSEDRAGNMNISQVTFTVDTIGPAIAFEDHTSNSTNYSQSWIYANISAVDIGVGLDTITITLYDSDLNLNSTSTNTTSPAYYNFTDLTDGIWYLNATANDTLGQENYTSTRTIYLDTTYPLIDYADPTEEDYANKSQTWIFVNVSVTEIYEKNITFNLYNATSNVSLYNSTFTNLTHYINWTSLTDEDYTYNVTICDAAGNCNSTSTRHINLDTAEPLIDFVEPTENDSTVVNRDWIAVNVTSTDTHLKNITIYLYNSTLDLINSTTVSTSPHYLNFTDLDDGTYWFNSTAYDYASNSNSTSTRNVSIDTIAPKIQFVDPTEESGYYFQTDIPVNVTATDDFLDTIVIYLYNDSGLINSTSSSTSPLFINFTNLAFDTTYYINATANDTGSNSNSTETRTLQLINLYELNATLTTNDFIFNVTNMTGVFEPINQTNETGIILINNTEDQVMNITIRINETYPYTYGNITLYANDEYNYSTANMINTSWNKYHLRLAVDNTTYIFMWAAYDTPLHTWFPTIEIKGMTI